MPLVFILSPYHVFAERLRVKIWFGKIDFRIFDESWWIEIVEAIWSSLRLWVHSKSSQCISSVSLVYLQKHIPRLSGNISSRCYPSTYLSLTIERDVNSDVG